MEHVCDHGVRDEGGGQEGAGGGYAVCGFGLLIVCRGVRLGFKD